MKGKLEVIIIIHDFRVYINPGKYLSEDKVPRITKKHRIPI